MAEFQVVTQEDVATVEQDWMVWKLWTEWGQHKQDGGQEHGPGAGRPFSFINAMEERFEQEAEQQSGQQPRQHLVEQQLLQQLKQKFYRQQRVPATRSAANSGMQASS